MSNIFDSLYDDNIGSPDYYDYENFTSTTNSNFPSSTSNEFTFKMPNRIEKGGKDFFKNLKNNEDTKAITEILKGTTTLGFVYNGGVIMAVDSRASMGTFMGSKTVKKVIEINDFLLGSLAGGAADCQFWLRKLNLWCTVYELKYGERSSVGAAANFLSNMINDYRGRDLSMGTMISGFDNDGFHLYYVDDDGKCLNGKIFSAGSGSTYAFGVVDSKYRYDMTEEEAARLGYEAICHATYRDIGSGGYVRVYSITKNGWKRLVDGDDVNDFHWRFNNERGLRGDGDESKNEKLKI